MKRTYLIPFALLMCGILMWGLSSCVQSEQLNPECEEPEQQFFLQLADADNGADTRAGRPLYSSEPGQQINRVMCVICNKENGTIVSLQQIADWEEVSEIYTTGGHGRMAQIDLNYENRLPMYQADYILYAIGYTYAESGDRTSYTVTDGNGKQTNLHDYLLSLQKGKNFSANLILSLQDTPGEEIFAGSREFTVSTDGGFKETVILNRQVAGAFVYVSDIPYFDGVAKLRLMAAADNDGLVLGKFDNEDILQNGQGATNAYVMNGTNPKSGTDYVTLCEIDLVEWFKDGQVKNDGGIVSVENWMQPQRYAGKATFQTGAFYAGGFVIPFAATDSRQSLKLGLFDADGSPLKREWKVNLSQSDLNRQAGKIWTWTNDQFIQSNFSETKGCYSLLRNHLYCIGRRDKDNLTGTNGDEPQPLEGVSELIIRVIADWDIVYDMQLEPKPTQVP